MELLLVFSVCLLLGAADGQGAAPKPYITIVSQTQTEALLRCLVLGASPKPEVWWEDSHGNILTATNENEVERGGSYDIILHTNVTKTDHYHCVVTPQGSNHRTEEQTYVYISGAAPKPYITIVSQTQTEALLRCLVLGASPKPKVWWEDSNGKNLPATNEDEVERGGSYDIILHTNVTKTDHYHCVVTPQGSNHRTKGQIYVYISGDADEPYITILEETKDQALLECKVLGVSPKPAVWWEDSSGNKLPAKEEQVTERGGRYDIILHTAVTKTDHYHCVVTPEGSDHRPDKQIYVLISGAADKPSVTVLEETKDQALLECKVLGASPKPAVWWEDSHGNKLPAKEEQVTERGGSYDILLHTIVTKTDHYHCVVTPEGSDHRTDKHIYVFISGAETESHKNDGTSSYSALEIIGIIAILIGIGIGIAIVYRKCKRRPGGPRTDATNPHPAAEPMVETKNEDHL